MVDELIEAVIDLREEEALKIVRERLDAGYDAMEILDLTRSALTIVGDRFEKQECFLTELVMVAEIFTEIAELVKPQIETVTTEHKGKVLIGTVEGDIHDLGKNIITLLLEANGYEVRDLGVDVSAETFVEAIKEFEPQVVGFCGLLTMAYDSMKETVEAIKQAGLRDKVKIMIRGSQINDQILGYVGADAIGTDAMKAVELTKKWTEGA